MRDCFAVIAAALMILAAVSASAVTHIVDGSGGGDFETVQAAVDAASTGDTLLIRAGIYEENVLVIGSFMTWIGEGAGVTIIRAAAAEPAILMENAGISASTSTFRSLTVESHIGNPAAVVWDEGYGRFHDCELAGDVGGGEIWGGLLLENCSAWHAYAAGGDVSSFIGNCTLSSLSISGVYVFGSGGASYWRSSYVEVEDSTVGDVHLTWASLEAASSTIGPVSGTGDSSGCEATECELGTIELGSAAMDLRNCTVDGGIAVDGWLGIDYWHAGDLVLVETLIEGGITVDLVMLADSPFGGIHIVHSTVVGGINYSVNCDDFFVWPCRIRSSVFTNEVELPSDPSWWWPVISHNDFVGGFAVPPADSVYANISADPLFCGEMDYELQECSPCVGAGHDGGDMGVYGVGCPCYSTVESRSWGAIKAMYRQSSD
jgi:sulfopyruvate decarboxylase TPP-binding subunit